MASVCALDLVTAGLVPADRVLLYTFGQLRVGDHRYAAAVDKHVPNAFRVVHSADLVPQVP